MREKEYNGNIFILPKNDSQDACLVTTNGIVRNDGKAVMGAGIAKYCRDTFHGVDRLLGTLLKEHGNHVYDLGLCFIPENRATFRLFSFPTKQDWKEDSKPELIRQSCKEMMEQADRHGIDTVYMPCPGCSNGKLDYWHDVRPILEEELDDRFIICIPKIIMDRKDIRYGKEI